MIRLSKMLTLGAVILAALACLAGPAAAVQINWTDWQSYAWPNVVGAIHDPNGDIGITYTNTTTNGIYTVQTGSGTNYWTQGSPAPYTGNAVVDNAPTPAEMIGLNALNGSVVFSQPVTGLIMAFVSWNTAPITFDQPFQLLSEGAGYWGNGTWSVSGNTLNFGGEVHGVIQFEGSFSSLNWTGTGSEHWHGITFGLPGQPVVPIPGAIWLLGAGLLGLAGLKKKMKQ